ncbi:hypothetical protein CCP3SC15_60038 [Gammaproteobacteria bacterium]
MEKIEDTAENKKEIRSSRILLNIENAPLKIEVYDKDAILAKYVMINSELALDYSEIENALSSGAEIPGTRLVRSTRLIIR